MAKHSTIIIATNRSIRMDIGDDGAPVSIYAGTCFGRSEWNVDVNWSTFGSVTPEQADSYATTIQVAAETASWLADRISDVGDNFDAEDFAQSLLGTTFDVLDIIEISAQSWVWTQANGLDTGVPATMKGGE